MHTQTLALFLSIPALLAAAVSADDRLSEEDFFGELPVVLSVTRLQTPIRNTPAAVTIITRRDIEASGIRDLPEIFRLVPGMQVGYKNGHVPSVTYHGFADQWSRGMQVLIDGRSVYSPGIGGVEWADMPLAIEDIEKIEVIRGPNGATYGANSYSGVISITTSHPSQQLGTLALARSGADGIQDVTLRHAGSYGALDYRTTFAFRSDDGFDARYDGKKTRLLGTRLNFQPGTLDQLELQLGFSESDKQDGFARDDEQPLRVIEARGNFQQLRWQHTWNDANHSALQFYHDFHKRKEPIGGAGALYDFSPPLPAFAPYVIIVQEPNDLTSERYDFELQHTLAVDDYLRAVFGGSVRIDRVRAPFYLATPRRFENDLQRLFANIELTPVDSLVLNAGALLENNDITGEDISPRFAVNWHVVPNHTLRFSISEAKRTPGFLENDALVVPLLRSLSLPIPEQRSPYIVIKGPGNLDPESLLSRELGYVGRLDSLDLDIDLRVFRDSFSDRIGFDAAIEDDNIGRQFGNVDKATIQGWETQLRWTPDPATRISLSYSRASSRSPTDGRRQNIKHSTPRHTAGLLVDHQFDQDLDGSLAYYFVSKHSWMGEGTSLDSSTLFDTTIRRLDLRLAKHINLASQELTIAGTLQNALGTYVDFYHDNTRTDRRNIMDQRAFVTVAMDF